MNIQDTATPNRTSVPSREDVEAFSRNWGRSFPEEAKMLRDLLAEVERLTDDATRHGENIIAIARQRNEAIEEVDSLRATVTTQAAALNRVRRYVLGMYSTAANFEADNNEEASLLRVIDAALASQQSVPREPT